MYVEIDLSIVVPATVPREPDDFTSFKVVVREAEHAACRSSRSSGSPVGVPRSGGAPWPRKDAGYAEQHGWVDDGGVRAHIELRR